MDRRSRETPVRPLQDQPCGRPFRFRRAPGDHVARCESDAQLLEGQLPGRWTAGHDGERWFPPQSGRGIIRAQPRGVPQGPEHKCLPTARLRVFQQRRSEQPGQGVRRCQLDSSLPLRTECQQPVERAFNPRGQRRHQHPERPRGWLRQSACPRAPILLGNRFGRCDPALAREPQHQCFYGRPGFLQLVEIAGCFCPRSSGDQQLDLRPLHLLSPAFPAGRRVRARGRRQDQPQLPQ